jgi:hypothetical protein
MKIIVHVGDKHLRGVPFERYSSVLGNLIGEGHQPDECDIVPGQKTKVMIDGRTKGEDVAEILSMAKEITDKHGMDGFFSRAEWIAHYGTQAKKAEVTV